MEKRESSKSGFKKETMNNLLQLHFKDDQTRVSGDAVLLMAEMLKIFVREAATRGTWQAQTEDVTTVDVEQVETVLPQLCTYCYVPDSFWITSNCQELLERTGAYLFC